MLNIDRHTPDRLGLAAVIHLDETRALEPLRTVPANDPLGDSPETPASAARALELGLDEVNGHGTFSDRGCDPFHRPAAHVTYREDAGPAGFEQHRSNIVSC